MRFYTSAQLHRNQILIRGYEDGKRVQYKVPAMPYLFVPTKNPKTIAEAKYKTLRGQVVEKLPFDSTFEAREFQKKYENVQGFEFYGLNNFLYTYINDAYAGEIKFDPEMIKVMYLDIEVAADDGFPDIKLADKPVTAISVKVGKNVVAFGCGDFVIGDRYKGEAFDVTYVRCDDEQDLLAKFLLLWEHENYAPDVLSGWNVEFFDVPYLVNRITVLKGEDEAKRLSPWGMLEEKSVISMGREQQAFVPAGVAILDYLALYKKFSFKNQESYKLDYIAEVEIDEKKIDYSEYGSLLELYKQDHDKFIFYNIHDILLVDKLEDKLGLIQQVFTLAYNAKVNYIDTLGTIRAWDVMIHNHLLEQGIVIPQQRVSRQTVDVPGGHVKEVQLGMHKWIVSVDFDALYPTLIEQFNISPEMLCGRLSADLSVDDLLDDKLVLYRDQIGDNACTANMVMYKRDKMGFMPALMKLNKDNRNKFKAMMLESKKKLELSSSIQDKKDVARYNNMQMACKINNNGFYGALASIYCRWFDVRLASSITLSGQLAIRWIEKAVNRKLNAMFSTIDVDYVIASDTDSLYFTLDTLVQKIMPNETNKNKICDFIDKVHKEVLEPCIDEACETYADYTNSYQRKLHMKREAIASRGVWIAKKMYILNVIDNEDVRYKEPQLKMMGVAAVRSSTPMAIRKKLKKTFELMMNTDESTVQKFIAEFKEEFQTLPFEEVAFPRGVSDLEKWRDPASIYKKSCPIAVRGALLYNHFIDENKLGKKLERIHSGDKVKFAYLKTPNHIKENVISVPGELPKQFKLEGYIDRQQQFDKGYIEPIKSVFDVIGWSPEKRNSVMDFFG